jgi:hypothetical protein
LMVSFGKRTSMGRENKACKSWHKVRILPLLEWHFTDVDYGWVFEVIKVISFRNDIPFSMQGFSYSYLYFPNSIVHVIVFYKIACASFTLTCINY